MTKYSRVNGYANELQLRCQPHKSLAGAAKAEAGKQRQREGREAGRGTRGGSLVSYTAAH